jgi:hypothetical protein
LIINKKKSISQILFFFKKKISEGRKEEEKMFTFMAAEELNSMNESSMESTRPSHSWSSHASLCWKLWQKP